MRMSDKICDMVGIAPKSGLFGLEIEVEGTNLPEAIRGWNTTRDGSLRGDENMEYVFSRPVASQGAITLLDRLDTAYKDRGSVINETIRAGTHIHLNFSDLTIRQLFNFLTVYYILEETLCRYCGNERCGNHFCLRIVDAYYPIRCLAGDLENGRFRSISSDNIRYAALNLTSLFRHGSLEFRAMRSTRDLGAIKDLLFVFEELYKSVSSFKGTPVDIIGLYSGDGDEFLLNEFIPNTRHIIINNGDFRYEDEMKRGMRNTLEFVYATDWKE